MEGGSEDCQERKEGKCHGSEGMCYSAAEALRCLPWDCCDLEPWRETLLAAESSLSVSLSFCMPATARSSWIGIVAHYSLPALCCLHPVVPGAIATPCSHSAMPLALGDAKVENKLVLRQIVHSSLLLKQKMWK